MEELERVGTRFDLEKGRDDTAQIAQGIEQLGRAAESAAQSFDRLNQVLNKATDLKLFKQFEQAEAVGAAQAEAESATQYLMQAPQTQAGSTTQSYMQKSRTQVGSSAQFPTQEAQAEAGSATQSLEPLDHALSKGTDPELLEQFKQNDSVGASQTQAEDASRYFMRADQITQSIEQLGRTAESTAQSLDRLDQALKKGTDPELSEQFKQDNSVGASATAEFPTAQPPMRAPQKQEENAPQTPMSPKERKKTNAEIATARTLRLEEDEKRRQAISDMRYERKFSRETRLKQLEQERAKTENIKSERRFMRETRLHQQEMERQKKHEEQLRLPDERHYNRRERYMWSLGGAAGRFMNNVASFGHDPMGGGASMLTGIGGGIASSRAALSGILGGASSLLGPIGWGIFGAGMVGSGLNALSRQYEQLSPLNYNAQLSGTLNESRENNLYRFNQALDRATTSAVRFGTSIEQAAQLQGQAMRAAATDNMEEAQGIADKVLRYKNVYGASEAATLNLEANYRRYSGQENAAAQVIAFHKDRMQLPNSVIDESLQGAANIYDRQLSRGFAGDVKDSLQSIGRLLNMRYSGSGERYSSADAARMVGRVDAGFASAAAGGSDTDLLALNAAMKSSGSNNLLEARKTLEEGFSGNPELLREYMKNISAYSSDPGVQVNLIQKAMGLSYTQADALRESYGKAVGEGRNLTQDDIDKVSKSEAALSPQQQIVANTQAIRHSVVKMGENTSHIKEGVLALARRLLGGDKELNKEIALSKYGEMSAEELGKSIKEDTHRENFLGAEIRQFQPLMNRAFMYDTDAHFHMNNPGVHESDLTGIDTTRALNMGKERGQIDNDGNISYKESLVIAEILRELLSVTRENREAKQSVQSQKRSIAKQGSMVEAQ